MGVQEMNELKLPRLVSDHMVLQRNKKVHIWGYDRPGRRVMISFRGEEYLAVTDEKGYFETELSVQTAGGPFSMLFKDDEGNEAAVVDVMVGEVWYCSGQSNMELPMDRVKDMFPEDVVSCRNPYVRTFKITENGVFTGPLKEPETGEWKVVSQDNILSFSAMGYYFARELQQLLQVPVGFIDASLGGSLIESWMSREMLQGMEEELALADRYADAEFVKKQLAGNVTQNEAWHRELDAKDQGLCEHWEKPETDTASWNPVAVPFWFTDTELKGFIGSVWFRRTFTVSKEMAGKRAKLWLGTIVDSDVAYVNGVQVGVTYYQYPPRKYEIPEGLLKEGENTLVLRVISEKGEGRFTMGKKYAVFNDAEEIGLQGEWSYRIGAECEQVPPTDFVNWKPTGLYNGMTAPCHQYTIAGVNWYQGESNTHHPDNYLELLKRMMDGYRKEWKEPQLPFQIVELPNLMVDMEGAEEGWRILRELQRQAGALPDVGVVTTIDLGEDNDLHPQNKKELGRRLACLCAVRQYGLPIEGQGPEVVSHELTKTENGVQIVLACAHADGMYAFSEDKGTEITDFEVVDQTGQLHRATVRIEGAKLLLEAAGLQGDVAEIRYCYRTSNTGALIYNEAGFPMSPFVIKNK